MSYACHCQSNVLHDMSLWYTILAMHIIRECGSTLYRDGPGSGITPVEMYTSWYYRKANKGLQTGTKRMQIDVLVWWDCTTIGSAPTHDANWYRGFCLLSCFLRTHKSRMEACICLTKHGILKPTLGTCAFGWPWVATDNFPEVNFLAYGVRSLSKPPFCWCHWHVKRQGVWGALL